MSNILDYLKGLLHGQEKIKRDKWGSSTEYYFCSLGFAVGFGCLWRFHSLLYANGGGAFLIPYCIFVLVLSFPILYLETAIGQTFQTSVTGCLQKSAKNLKALDYQKLSLHFSWDPIIIFCSPILLFFFGNHLAGICLGKWTAQMDKENYGVMIISKTKSCI